MRDKLLNYFEQEKEIYGSISLNLQKVDLIFSENNPTEGSVLNQKIPVKKVIINTDQQMKNASNLNDLNVIMQDIKILIF